MRIFKKAAVSVTAVGLLAFGGVAGSAGSALAGKGPQEALVTGCTAVAAKVTIGLRPNCTAIGGTVDNPTVIIIDVDTEALSALIGENGDQGMDAAWTLSCIVNGTHVNVPGSYDITSTGQSPETTINLQAAVGSPEPNQCTVENLTVETALAFDDGAGGLTPFPVGIVAVASTATPGGIYQEKGATPGGANAALCADDTGNGNAGSKIQGFQCRNDLADTFVQTSSGQFVHNGDCLGLSGSKVILASCTAGKASQQWAQSTVGGTVKNRSTNTCLTAPSAKDGVQLTVASCGSGADQKWGLPAMSAAPILPCAAVRFAKPGC